MTIYTQGVKGGCEIRQKQGRVSIYSGNNSLLVVDNFSGSADCYRQRPEPIIIIYDGINSPNEVVMFEGTHSQLVDLLSKAQ